MVYVLFAALIILSIIYSVLIYHLEKDFKAERKDLYNRIMSKDLHEYQSVGAADTSKIIKNQILAKAKAQEQKRREG